MRLFIFSVDDTSYALPLSVVEKVYPSAQVVTIQDAPKSVLGIVNIQGDILPVVHFQTLIGLDARPLALDDKFVVIRWEDRRIVLVVDKVFSALEVEEVDYVDANELVPDAPSLIGVAKVAGQLILIQNVDQLLSPFTGQMDVDLEVLGDA